ncbi:hypothetical protein [Paenibacillus amylolyticus]|uniref:hypothetical protein n=1 Tax=Paenibacillus amylolyticus TaxID=1451 RepID=UPI00201D2D24|nr:hypothetical protein [Paenibacillus amylolyticus]
MKKIYGGRYKMAILVKRLAKGQLNTTKYQVYTVPVGTTTIVKAITICNGSNGDVQFDIEFAGEYIIFNHTIKGYDTITIPFIDQVLHSGEKISVRSTNASAKFFISGKEVT